MYQIGIINQNYSEDEMKQLCRKFFHDIDCRIAMLNIEELEQTAHNLDVVLILNDSSNFSLGDNCSMIIRIRELTEAYIMVYQKEIEAINRVIYLQLGANLNITAASYPKEVQLMIQNELKHRLEHSQGAAGTMAVSAHNTAKRSRRPFLNEIERKIDLTRIEYKLLYLLQSDAGKIFSHKEIYQFVWKKTYTDQKPRVANVVFRLREKLDRNGFPSEKYIHTAHGIGYKLLIE